MRSILLLLLSSCVLTVDDPPQVYDPCGPDTVCFAANLIAGEYCGRHERCYGTYDPDCRYDTADAICSTVDCAGYYPYSNQQRLAYCLDQRDRVSCWSAEPPQCSLF